MPCASASRGDLKLRCSPPSVIVPSSGAMTPEMILPSVDFPAPFSPTSACTVPGVMVSETSLRAGTPPYRFDTPVTTKSPPEDVAALRGASSKFSVDMSVQAIHVSLGRSLPLLLMDQPGHSPLNLLALAWVTMPLFGNFATGFCEPEPLPVFMALMSAIMPNSPSVAGNCATSANQVPAFTAAIPVALAP